MRHAVFNWKYKSAIVETNHESVTCKLFSEEMQISCHYPGTMKFLTSKRKKSFPNK